MKFVTDGSMRISDGIDRTFGRKGFSGWLKSTREVGEILSTECGQDMVDYGTQYRKYWLYD